jgi:membrane-bound lytic murein transglycosylase D
VITSTLVHIRSARFTLACIAFPCITFFFTACSVAPVANTPTAPSSAPSTIVTPAAPAARPSKPPAAPNAQTPAPVAAAPQPPVSAPAAKAPATVEDIIKSEPAVVIAKEDLADPKATADLWERIRGGFALNELPTPLVADKEKFYTSKPEYLQN